jgi:hypothetical protein
MKVQPLKEQAAVVALLNPVPRIAAFNSLSANEVMAAKEEQLVLLVLCTVEWTHHVLGICWADYSPGVPHVLAALEQGPRVAAGVGACCAADGECV